MASNTLTELQRWADAMLEAAMHSGGAGPRTARQDKLKPGRGASEYMANTDWPMMQAHLADILACAEKHDLPAALICGIISRESRAGAALRAGHGDNGHAYGVMQIDYRYHDVVIGEGPWSAPHIAQGCGILALYRDRIERKHEGWPDWAVLKSAAAAYNVGTRNVKTIERMDIGTTGGDYSADVMTRAWWYHREIKA